MLPLDQSILLQLTEKLCRFLVRAAKGVHGFFQGVYDIDPSILIKPAVLQGQIQPVQEQAVQLFRKGIHSSVAGIRIKGFRYPVEGKPKAFPAVEILRHP